MFTIEPPPARRIGSTAAFMPRKVPVWLTRTTRSKSASSVSSRAAMCRTAALLTSTSSFPNSATASSTACFQASSRVTSRWTKRAASPSSTATRAPCASSRSPITTRAPSAANRRAVASPVPRAAPLSRATLPSRAPIAISLGRRESRHRLVLLGERHLDQLAAAQRLVGEDVVHDRGLLDVPLVAGAGGEIGQALAFPGHRDAQARLPHRGALLRRERPEAAGRVQEGRLVTAAGAGGGQAVDLAVVGDPGEDHVDAAGVADGAEGVEPAELDRRHLLDLKLFAC